ncbi:LuxR C-terminal-related transcriptional regulator [Kitasatospora sp. NBC_01246]|uniref:LuxR C-terminal-related transcriptional regulator n=1 Tax=Kitasatospora sp. NBC_01246 TaxID=2903570 RepID=UPI002E2F458C|nr:LuxR C-terminal-related transcriptional regulator [Kitasatospora sp. NBC_01246]
MTTPPTAERPADAAAANHPARTAGSADPPAPQGRLGKGRPGKGRTERGRGAQAAAGAAGVAGAAGAAGPGRATGANGPAGDQSEALRLLRQLTPREAQALAHLAAGRDLAQSAAALGVTPATARSYQHRAMRKLGTRTHGEIVAFAALLSPAQGASGGPAGPPDTPGSDTPVEQPAGRERRGHAKARPAGPGDAASHGAPRPGEEAPTPRPAADSTPTHPGPPRPNGGKAGAAHTPAASGTPRTDDGTPGAPATGAVNTPAAAGTPRTDGRTAPRSGPASGAPPRPNGGRPAGTAAKPPARTDPADGPAPAGSPRTDGGSAPEPNDHGPATAALAAANAAGATSEHLDAVPVPSFEELYEAAHTRLVQQVFLLTSCKHRAVHCVRLAFGEARRHWDEVAAGADPEGWVRARACEAALSPWHRGGPRRTHVWRLPHRRIKVRPADESQAVLPDHDRLTDRDRALLKALKRLSRPQRRALVLHDGLGLPAAAVAVEVESTVAAAEGRVWAARTALAEWVPDLVGPDPAAEGFADGLAGLLHRAAVRGCPEPQRPPVPVLRARHRLANATRTGAAVLITVAVGGAAAATLAGSGPGSLFHRAPEPPKQAVCGAVNGSAVPLVPDGPPTGIRSLWCSPTPGVEPVVADPPPPRAPLWELPAAARAAAALPPPGSAGGPAACTRWSLLPCPADR